VRFAWQAVIKLTSFIFHFSFKVWIKGGFFFFFLPKPHSLFLFKYLEANSFEKFCIFLAFRGKSLPFWDNKLKK